MVFKIRGRYGKKTFDIINQLIEYWKKTPKHINGNILGSMTTYPHPLAVYAYNLFIHVNAADPVIFPIVKEFEQKIIRKLKILYGNIDSIFVSSGGTESNFLALIAARRENSNRENIVVAPSTVHVSIDKACEIMNCRVLKIPVDNRPVDPSILEEYIRRYKPFAVVITAGTTERGIIDPIKEAASVAYDTDTYLHVDAAYGGLLVPFLYKHGLVNENLYLYEGISSVSIDFHKNGLTPIPSSILMFSHTRYRELICFEASYTLVGKTCGLLGTRPGGSIAAIWAILEYYGFEGFEEQALRLMSLADELYRGLYELGELIVYEPILPIIVFKHKVIDTEVLLKEYLRSGYYLYRSPSLNALRIVVMPHITIEHVKRFLEVSYKIFSSYVKS